MDVKLINPFINATINVLETMAFMSVEAGKPYVKKDNTAVGDVTGVIGLTGVAHGTIAVTFEENCILTVVSNMLGEAMKTLNEDISDAVGELTNMISGQARVGLAELGLDFVGSVPAIIVGEKHIIKHLTDEPVVAVPFTSSAGPFTIEFCFER